MNFFSKICFTNIVTILLCITCNGTNAQTRIVSAFPNLSFSNPVDIQHAGDNSNRLFVVSQKGIIHVFENKADVSSSFIFLDIQDQILFGGEQGLLGLAFHPEYKTNGYFYVNYTVSNPIRTIVSRFNVSTSNPNQADLTTKLVLLEVDQPYSNHNGGQLSFGHDGYLYISFGDGGSGGDPENRAQNLSTLLGKIVRIDVNNKENNKNYSIPDDNPFVGNIENFNEEIYAYGLRNVWRFSFDSSGNLWAADVGQNKWEEINIIENGGNYGWRIMEGAHCYNPNSGCNQEGLVLPILEYDHSSSGGYSITGGYVYEGINAPGLMGKYIYADFETGNIWAYNKTNGTNELITNYNAHISTFGIDENNNLYFADLYSGFIYKFTDDNVSHVGDQNPNIFQLNQNYPNPFNPTTHINYSIPSGETKHALSVQLRVYDVLGSEVAELVNKSQPQGNYEIIFDASNLTNGVYFYRLQAGKFIDTKKFILLK